MSFRNNPICKLLNIEYPIIQAGMIWVSGGKLAAACANSGILGIVGAGSMSPELLDQHLKKACQLTTKPIGVNIPLLFSKAQEQIDIALKNGVRIFFTSAGSPKKYTPYLKEKGAKVIHVTSTPQLATKCEQAGVDAIVAEGFEAGGHNGKDEITTMTLIPQVVDSVSIPVIAAGGIGDGRTMLAAMVLGASGVQMGTRFVTCHESSAHQNFKNAIIESGPCDTMLSLKNVVPVRLLKNKFYNEITEMTLNKASVEELSNHLGKGRAKKGMLEGDLDEGELEIGQISALIKDSPKASDLVDNIIREYAQAKERIL